MDITAKHAAPDKNGVRIAELDEESFRYLLWDHKPLTDFWMTGPGTVKRLEKRGIHTMGELAYFSTVNQDILYKEFGVDAELLIDHAWGLEPCGMKEIKAYRPSTNSISEGQVLSCPYPYDKARIIVMEMADSLVLQLTDKRLVTDSLTLDCAMTVKTVTAESTEVRCISTTMAALFRRVLMAAQNWIIRPTSEAS